MEFQYYGGNIVRITTKHAAITIDDAAEDLGLRSPMKAGDIALYTGAHGEPPVSPKIVIDQPGEYEVSHISLQGIGMRAHMDEETARSATMFKLTADDMKVLITGHIYPELSEDQLESIGLIDIMIIPVGGSGYTLDGVGALKVIKDVDPKIVIPVHYADKSVKYPVPQQEISEVLHALGMEASDTLPKLKLKPSDLIEGGKRLIILERQ